MTTDRKPRWRPYLEMLELMATANEKAGKKTPDYFPKAIGTNGARTILSIEPKGANYATRWQTTRRRASTWINKQVLG
jgi:hypothetical protein